MLRESTSARRQSLTRWQLVSIKKFMLNALGVSICLFQNAVSLYLISLIFVGKLEMVISSVHTMVKIRSENDS